MNILMPIAAGALLVAAGLAQADTKGTTFNVSANVNKNCFVSATNMDFGAYDGSQALNGESDIDVRCSRGTLFTIALNDGGSGRTDSRELLNGSEPLEYNLYTNAGRTVAWGDGTALGVVVSDQGEGLGIPQAINFPVYGLLPNNTANQNAPQGSYTDTIDVTVTY
jgi:spore coat protein U-like protein